MPPKFDIFNVEIAKKPNLKATIDFLQTVVNDENSDRLIKYFNVCMVIKGRGGCVLLRVLSSNCYHLFMHPIGRKISHETCNIPSQD